MPLRFRPSARCAALVAVLAFVTGCSEPRQSTEEDAASPTTPASGGTIKGRVIVEGAVAAPPRIRIDGDPQCVSAAGEAEVPDEEIVIGGDGGLQNVFVYVKEGATPQKPRAHDAVEQSHVVLDQQKCRYTPHVLGIQVGQRLTIRNSDALLHTVRADARVNARFNVATPVRGIEVVRTFDRPEVMVPIKCDMHPWMQAYVGVLDHPYFAVTGAAGEYAIAGLPPGEYLLGIWHERLGTQTRTVSLSDGETIDATFTFSSPTHP